MKKIRNLIYVALAAGLVMRMIFPLSMDTPVLGAGKVRLSHSKITVKVGKTKTIKVKNTGKKVTWKVLSGKKNLSITKGKNSVKVKGKKAGRARLQAKAGKRRLTCLVTIVKNESAKAADGDKIAVSSNKYTVVFRLNNSSAAKDLLKQLPLTLKVENFSDNEKIFYSPKGLDIKGTPKSKGKKSSLAYYKPWDDVVMFYGAASPASGLYELGTVISGGNHISKLSGRITIRRAG